MLGAIMGDMIGSLYEFHPIKTKDFDIYNPDMDMTDDSYLTIEVAKALLKHYPFSFDEQSLAEIKEDLIKGFVKTWKEHRAAGFGGMFYAWCVKASRGVKPESYNS